MAYAHGDPMYDQGGGFTGYYVDPSKAVGYAGVAGGTSAQAPKPVVTGTTFSGVQGTGTLAPTPAPTPAPVPGIINNAITSPFGGIQNTVAPPAPQVNQPLITPGVPAAPPAPTAAPAPSPFGMVGGPLPPSPAPAPTAPAPAPATGMPPPPAPYNPQELSQYVNTLNWAPDNKPASAYALKQMMAQKGWTVANLSQVLGYTEAELQEVLNLAAPAPGAPGQPPAPGQPGGTGGIISSSRTSAQQLGNPTDWNVTADQTVEGRINNIINPSNPIIAQARARSLDAMNARGLANSSLAVTAGDSAAYDAAIPIATADAATFAKASGYNADQKNQFAARNVEADNQFLMADKNNQNAKDLALLDRDSRVILTKLSNDNQVVADKFKADNDKLLNTNAKATEVFNTGMSAISAIENNPGMDADTKTRAAANVWQNMRMQLKVMGDVAGIDLVTKLDMRSVPGFDENGNWAGFEDGPGAITRNANSPPPPPPPPPPPAADSGGGGSGYTGGAP